MPNLPILDIEEIKVFNRLIPYKQNRNFQQLNNNPLIKKLDDKIKYRVISSMLSPKKECLKLHNELASSVVCKETAEYTIALYEKIIEKYNPKKITLVAILRSGLLLAFLLRYIIYKIHNIETDVLAITPNYIEKIEVDSLKNHIKKSDKNILFIDGWCSEGTTYRIVKKFWKTLFPNKEFTFAVLSNPSPIKNKDLFCATNKDVLIPWSLCQTDNLGLSNFFLNPTTNKTCAFVIPEDKRKLKNKERTYRKIIDVKIKNNCKIDNLPYPKRTGVLKIGINECIKSIDKKDDTKLYISNKLKDLHSEILKKYAKINSIKYQPTTKNYCFIVKDVNQL